MQFIGKSAKELKEGLIPDDECSYQSELDVIIEKKFMFKIMVKESNINKHDEVYKVVKFVDDEVLFKEYNHPSLIYNEPLFEGGQNYGGDELFEAPIKNSLSGCRSSLTDIKVDTTEKQTFKRSKSIEKLLMQEYDEDCNDKQSTNKVRKVIKKEKEI
ncbi:putative MATE efflux family protein 6-like [Capsicum annuum]|nr:putative MATE efflux family protein 6-like [Capsicum annuum]